jgi:hypothetical protein
MLKDIGPIGLVDIGFVIPFTEILNCFVELSPVILITDPVIEQI